jgi:ADP-heptose:LPS heptosyltransferase
VTHVLVARQDSAGDVLVTGPAIRAVAAGADRVTLLCGRRGRAAAELLPGIAAILEHTAPWIDPEPEPLRRAETLALVEALAAVEADEAIVFASPHQSPLPLALLLRLAGVPRVSAISDDYPGSLLDVRHRPSGALHEVERALSLAAAAGYQLPAGDDGRLQVERPGGPPPVEGRYVVVHPGTSVPARAWPPERHAELVRLLAREGRAVVVTGAHDERALTAAVAGGDALDLGGETSLAQLADVLAHADVLVVGNTGPAHVAAAVGTPVVSLFAPTVPAERWRPWRVPLELLGDQGAPCAGTRATVCPVPGHPCLCGVTAEEAVAAVGRLAGVRARGNGHARTPMVETAA